MEQLAQLGCYVRPLMECASCVWSPHHPGLIRKTKLNPYIGDLQSVYVTAET